MLENKEEQKGIQNSDQLWQEDLAEVQSELTRIMLNDRIKLSFFVVLHNFVWGYVLRLRRRTHGTTLCISGIGVLSGFI